MQRMLNVAKLVAVCHQIEGRKKLQKIVHLLREAGYHQEFSHQFGYLHYGPYSRELRHEIDSLAENSSLITESSISRGEFTSFTYSPSPELENLLEELEMEREPEWASLARELNSREAQELEAISTIIYLRRLGHAGGELKSKFMNLKPSLSDKYDHAFNESDRLIHN